MRTRADISGLDSPSPEVVNEEMREFAKVLRQALLMIVRYLEKRYQLGK